jgi:hypothetical protein
VHSNCLRVLEPVSELVGSSAGAGRVRPQDVARRRIAAHADCERRTRSPY